MRSHQAIAVLAATILLGSVGAAAWPQDGGPAAARPGPSGTSPRDAAGQGATTPVSSSPSAAPVGGATSATATTATAAAGDAAAKGSVTFPGIRIFPGERRAEVDAIFEIVDPAYCLEYLAVAPQGKVHESLFQIRCAPDKLNLALILCNLECKPEVTYQGEAIELTGPRVTIEVEWTAKGGARERRPVEALVDDARLGTPLDPIGFAYTGSRFISGRAGPRVAGGPPPHQIFAASASGSAIALYHDPDAVLDYAGIAGGDVPLVLPTFRLVEVAGWVSGDERFRPSAIVPPHGTPAVLHLAPAAGGVRGGVSPPRAESAAPGVRGGVSPPRAAPK